MKVPVISAALLQFSAGFFAWIDENPVSCLESWMTLNHCHTYWKKGISTWNSHHSHCGMEILSHSIFQQRDIRRIKLKQNTRNEKTEPCSVVATAPLDIQNNKVKKL
jgi:hypothetical protein